MELNVSGYVWAGTLVVMIAVLLADLFIIGRRPHEPSVRESSLWVGFYVGLALLFGAGLWLTAGASVAGQFYTGWLTEYSLSVDNLFVFVIIMARFGVPGVTSRRCCSSASCWRWSCGVASSPPARR